MLEPHELAHEFPEYKDLLAALKAADTRFAKLCHEYDALDGEILQIEQNVEAVSDVYAEELKKKRVALKDEIYRTLQNNAQR